MTFGERLYELRNAKNISQEELAELLDVSRQSISKWENNKAYPEMTRLLFMSDYFQVSLDYLMRGTEKEEHLTNGNSVVNYQVKSMLMLWNDFVSNLSEWQRKRLMLLYVLLVCVIAHFVYGGGYAIGQFLGNLKNDLNI